MEVELKHRIVAKLAKMDKEQMRNTEIAQAKNKRIQKALERDIYGPNGKLKIF